MIYLCPRTKKLKVKKKGKRFVWEFANDTGSKSPRVKHTRTSYPRVDYKKTTWGLMLEDPRIQDPLLKKFLALFKALWL